MQANCLRSSFHFQIMAAAKSPDALLPKLVQYALSGVDYTVTTFPDTMRDAEEIADLLGVPAAHLFKTLVVLPANAKGKRYLVMLAANQQLNLKLFAKAVGEKKLVMATHEQAEKLTRLQVGGISALALKDQNFKVYLDESAKQFEQIYVSGGQRGLDVKLPVADLVRITGAVYVKAA
jgi:Cys-tRNA(Pro)/Cys-tRNA(Cys) deacylase